MGVGGPIVEPSSQWGRRLRATIGLAEPALAAATSRFWSQPSLAKLFSEYLFCVYCSARGTVGVMAAANRRAKTLEANDPVARPLARYLEAHLEEERDHPPWLLSDLEAVGLPRAEAQRRIPPATVAALVGAQHFWVEECHPVAVLGLLAILEGFPPSASWLDSVRRRTGLPREAFRFLAAHAEIDPHHAADLWRLLDRLPMNRSQATLVGLSALHTMGALGELFDTLSSRPEGESRGR